MHLKKSKSRTGRKLEFQWDSQIGMKTKGTVLQNLEHDSPFFGVMPESILIDFTSIIRQTLATNNFLHLIFFVAAGFYFLQ